MALLLWVNLSMGGPWAQQEPELKLPTDFSAYTVGRNHGRVGIFDQDFGVWDNVDLGTTAALFLLGVPNAHAKVQAIQSTTFDVAFDVAWAGYDLEKHQDVPGGYLTVVPLGWTASWVASPKFSLHFGSAWLLATARGQVSLDQLGEGLAVAVGADLSDELANSLEDGGGLYAGAHLNLSQLRVAADYRVNRRDSIVLQTNTFLLLSGDLSGGYVTEDETVQVGASAHLEKPLTDQLQGVVTLSWQFAWERWYLRVGLPVPTQTIPLLWIPQAFEFYWTF